MCWIGYIIILTINKNLLTINFTSYTIYKMSDFTPLIHLDVNVDQQTLYNMDRLRSHKEWVQKQIEESRMNSTDEEFVKLSLLSSMEEYHITRRENSISREKIKHRFLLYRKQLKPYLETYEYNDYNFLISSNRLWRSDIPMCLNLDLDIDRIQENVNKKRQKTLDILLK